MVQAPPELRDSIEPLRAAEAFSNSGALRAGVMRSVWRVSYRGFRGREHPRNGGCGRPSSRLRLSVGITCGPQLAWDWTIESRLGESPHQPSSRPLC